MCASRHVCAAYGFARERERLAVGWLLGCRCRCSECGVLATRSSVGGSGNQAACWRSRTSSPATLRHPWAASGEQVFGLPGPDRPGLSQQPMNRPGAWCSATQGAWGLHDGSTGGVAALGFRLPAGHAGCCRTRALRYPRPPGAVVTPPAFHGTSRDPAKIENFGKIWRNQAARSQAAATEAHNQAVDSRPAVGGQLAAKALQT